MRFTAGTLLAIILLLSGFGFGAVAFAAPKAELWQRWQVNDSQSMVSIDHSRWGEFLDKYLVSKKFGAATLVRYNAVSSTDKVVLAEYIAELSAVLITTLNRLEQQAVWVNLYNALTVHVILEHYPVQSIREIRSGWFSSGPWDLKLLKIEGVELSLNDIEHRILRPIWQDNRVHYAVNCASLGCPNLQPEPFTAKNMDQLLDQAAREYVNSLRGVNFGSENLTVSSIYDWFQLDFGGSEKTMIDHLQQFAAPALAAKLRNYRGKIVYGYDWQLNRAD